MNTLNLLACYLPDPDAELPRRNGRSTISPTMLKKRSFNWTNLWTKFSLYIGHIERQKLWYVLSTMPYKYISSERA